MTGFLGIITKYIFNLSFLDEWIILYYTIFYTFTHNVNYSIFKVNKIHELHHKNQLTNLGPDISDIIFRTKNDINELENTDHYIYSILFSTFCVSIIKYLWDLDDSNKTVIKNIFIILAIGFSSFIAILSTYLFVQDYVKYNYSFDYMKKFYKKQWNNHNFAITINGISILVIIIILSIYNRFI
jgi:hypothetical protein